MTYGNTSRKSSQQRQIQSGNWGRVLGSVLRSFAKKIVLLEDSLRKSITTQYTYTPPPRHMVPPGVRQQCRHHPIFSLLLMTEYLVLQMG